ncbi:MAG: zinc-binding dehydrogenase [Chloroflexota bacterium]
MGHLVVQLAKRMDARVFAAAAGAEEVELAKRIGADEVVDGYKDDIVKLAMAFAPNGIDAVLLTVGVRRPNSPEAVRAGGRVAYPTGIHPEPTEHDEFDILNNGEPDRELIGRFNDLIGSDPFEVYISHTFALDQAAKAHQALEEHHNGKIVLKVA